MVIKIRWMVITIRWMVIKISSKLGKLELISTNGHETRLMVIKIRSKLVKLQLISMTIGQDNHLQTLFQTHSNILINCNWFWWMVIKIWSKWVETITSKHYFTLIPIFWEIVTGFDEWSSKYEANGLKQSPPNTISQSFLYSV